MNIAVLAGGISTERDVSLSSAVMIYTALKKKGHRAIILDVYLGYQGEDFGRIYEKDEDWTKEISGVKESNPDIEAVKAMRPDGDKNFFGPNVIAICQAADVVFLALHGENGENGKIQAAFDLMGISYTGSDCLSSAICMDKAIAKEILQYYQIPVPKGIRLAIGEQQKETVPYPCVVKVCCGGSSVGVSIVTNDTEYEKALTDCFQYEDEVVVEQYIRGREFSVGVIDGKALPVIEIAPLQGFYDYKNKYQAGSTIETCPADLEKEKTEEMQKYAEVAFAALRLKNYARMDFMMNESGELFCLEANTLPGMTPTSLLPQEARAMGIEFEDLCELIITLSLTS